MPFVCQCCQQSQPYLQVQPHLQAGLSLAYNAFDELVVALAGQEPFVADLGFMNRFARCNHCHALNRWAYEPPTVTAAAPAPSLTPRLSA
jgi:hypothetical protein